MKKNIKIGIIQFDIVWNNKKANFDQIEVLFEPLKNSIDLLLLPEMFDTGFVTDTNILNTSENELTRKWLSDFAEKNQIAIAGTTIYYENDNFYNRFWFFLPSGQFFYYDKRHLFSISGENKHLSCGKKRTVANFDDWRINLLVCYDLRFPVWARNRGDYDILLFPANWPISRIEQWKALLVARAIENQSFTIGINRIGVDEHGFEYPGKSIVIDPKGQIIYEAGNCVDAFVVEFDYDYLQKIRTNFPVLNDADNFQFTDL